VGSLTNTLVDLTNRSAAGMTAEQLGAKVRCRCHSVLVRLWRQGRLQREKIGRCHVYLAMDQQISAVQRRSFESLSVIELPAEVTVMILVEFIRNPQLSFDQLAAAISRRKGFAITPAQIERFFDQHGLKKTPLIVAQRL